VIDLAHAGTTATVDALDQQIEAAERVVAGLKALRARLAGNDIVEEGAIVDATLDRFTMDIAAARKRAGRSSETLRRWATRYDVGRQIAGRWRFDPIRLRAVLASENVQPSK
jgi:hypothetical protein